MEPQRLILDLISLCLTSEHYRGDDGGGVCLRLQPGRLALGPGLRERVRVRVGVRVIYISTEFPTRDRLVDSSIHKQLNFYTSRQKTRSEMIV